MILPGEIPAFASLKPGYGTVVPAARAIRSNFNGLARLPAAAPQFS